MPSISIKDIALKANVSVGTVDRVIHGRGKVSQKTEEKVLQVLKEANYTPNLMARSLAKNQNFKIAALIPHSKTDPFWKQPMVGILRAISFIESFGFSLDIYHFDDSVERDLLNQGMKIFEKQYDALLIAPIIRDESILLFDECEERGLPYVQINTLIERDSPYFLNYVGQDSYNSGVIAAKLMDFGIEENDTILVLHLEREVYNSEHLIRKEMGFRDYFKKSKSKNVQIEQLTFSDLFNEKKRKKFIKYTMKLYTSLTGIFVSTSKLHLILDDFKSFSKKPIKFVGFDLIEKNLALLQSDDIYFLINQNSIQQGYQGIMNLFNFLLRDQKGKRIQYVPLDVVMKENMDFYTMEQKFLEPII